jgi:hypothetical protein
MIKPQAAHNDNHYPDQNHNAGLFHKGVRTTLNGPKLNLAETKRKPANAELMAQPAVAPVAG